MQRTLGGLVARGATSLRSSSWGISRRGSEGCISALFCLNLLPASYQMITFLIVVLMLR